MDRTDARRAGSQSRLPRWTLFVLLAAVVFRLVTAALDRKAASAEGGGLVEWQAGATAPAAARASGKPILYDFTAEWCAPCKILDTDGWGHGPTARTASAEFVPVRVMDRLQEEGRNSLEVSALQARYRIGSFPTLVVADADGREISRQVGYRNRATLRAFLENAREKSRSPGIGAAPD